MERNPIYRGFKAPPARFELTTYGFEELGLGVYTVYMEVNCLWRPHFGVLDVQVVHSLYCFYAICTNLHQRCRLKLTRRGDSLLPAY
jgi:hypothetical protein